MTEDKAYQFSSFKFDPSAGRLWKGSEFRPIRRKTFALLEYLLANSGRLVTREDLLAAVWPEVNINEEGLTMCVHEAREALDDNPQSPRFIETVHGRGYRFMVPVTTIDAQEDPPPPLLTTLSPENSIVVGREAESARLQQSWQRAIAGKRQVLFISGEPGIGKTTIVDSLLGAIQESGEALIGRGQCLERYGLGEAYVPIFEALGQLCRGRQGKDVRQILLDRAPSWTMHMPEVFGAADAKPDRVNKAAAATSGRMMREIATALELLAALRPVMLICEDLHLGDRPSTIELIAYLARRRETARLFILGTYRTAEVQQDPNPMRQILHELRTHKECEELELKGLGKDAIAEYLRRRTPNAAIPETLAEQMYQRTGGNALFMASIADHLEARTPAGNGASPWPKDLRESGVPDNIREMIERQLERLSDGDQKLLRAASVAAAEAREFSAAALCAALYDDGGASAQDAIEEQCAALTHSTHFLRATEIARWPDGTIAASYLFPHALYQEVAYGLTTPGFRARAHLRIGERLEAAYGDQAVRIAAELALHFERGGDNRRAVKHAHAAASGAIARSANREAIAYVEKGLQLLKTLPRDSEGLQAEIDLETRRATALLDVAGFAAPELRQSHQRIIALVAELGQSPAQVFLAQGSARYVTAPKNLIEARAL
ncbi:MAG: AAA family ATPase, partial [Candidatus Binataceae bacterium]